MITAALIDLADALAAGFKQGPVPKTLRQLNGSPVMFPIGGRIRGLPGSGGAYDSTNTCIQDQTSYMTPLNNAVKSIQLVFSGFDVADQGEVDRNNTVTGYASIYLAGQTFSIPTSASSAAGLNTLAFTPANNAQTGPSIGMAVTGTNIPANSYVTDVSPSYNAGGTMSGLTVTINNTFTGGGISSAQSITFTGQIFPAKWGGTRQFTVEPMHDFLVSDPINVQIPANTQFFVRVFSQFANTGIALAGSLSGTTITGEGTVRGNGLSDNSLTPVTPGNSGGGFWPPAAILADLQTSAPLPSLLIDGDSITAGSTDTADAFGRAGYINKILNNTYCYLSLAKGGMFAQDLAASAPGHYAAAELISATDVLLELCRNDIWVNGRTAAQVAADLVTIATPLINAGKRVWAFTCPPYTTSTDGFTSAVNQAISSSTNEGHRQAYNVDMRANFFSHGFAGVIDMAAVIEDPLNPGKWNSAGGVARTADGVHPNAQGHLDLINANVLPLSSFTA